MRVMITGGTGFIGYHTAQALMNAGHEVRLLVRSREKMKRLFGDSVHSHVVGDVTDADAVKNALQGCDGAVHTAAMVSLDKRDEDKVVETNVGGTRLVLENALDSGVRRIIHVSSVTALYNPQATFLNEYSPPGSANNAYGRSKVESEIYVRELQDQGAPIHITYPASVIGPEDPAVTEPHEGLMTYLLDAVPVPPSGNQWVDVRDIALAHLRLLERDLPPGRYTLGGHFLTWTRLVDLLMELTGSKIRKIPVPGSLLLGLGRAIDWYNQIREKPLDLPVTHEGMVYATNWVKMDNSKALGELGVEFRPVSASLSDAIRSLVEHGHLEADKAGKLCE